MLEKNLDFLSKLKNNNNRDWFEAHRKEYEQSQEELLTFADAMIKRIQAFDPAISLIRPKDTVFRIYRDIRFSKDKTPYKTARGVVIKPGGRKSHFGSYYVHIEPGMSFAGGGIYHPPKPILDAMRKKIYFEYQAFFDIIDHADFKKVFGSVSSDEKLKRMPKGYEEGHPADDYLKYKSYIIGTQISDDWMTNPELADHLANILQHAMPFLHFINEAIEEDKEG